MKTIISMLLIASFIFSGCSTVVTEYVYVEGTCPRIEVLEPVGKIKVIVGPNGEITKESAGNLVNGARQLRKSEAYYIEQVTNYNEKFVKPIDN